LFPASDLQKKTDGKYVAFVSATYSVNPLAGPSWKAHIAPGMDPCLNICCLAILGRIVKDKRFLVYSSLMQVHSFVQTTCRFALAYS
jgi:hypothetical protein